MFGRRVLPTTLDPVPPNLRTCPGCVAINTRELAELRAGNGETFKLIAGICLRATELEARGIGVWRAWRRPRRLTKDGTPMAPSGRLAMANAIYKGRS